MLSASSSVIFARKASSSRLVTPVPVRSPANSPPTSPISSQILWREASSPPLSPVGSQTLRPGTSLDEIRTDILSRSPTTRMGSSKLSASIPETILEDPYIEHYDVEEPQRVDLESELKPSPLLETLSNPITIKLILFVIWCIVGMTWYCYYLNNWTWYNSFFYLMNAGLSIGYGSVMAETDDQIMHAFTTVYMISYMAFFAETLGYILSSAYNSTKDTFIEEDEPDGLINKLVSVFKANSFIIKTVCSYLLWIVVGCCYGIYFEGWNISMSLVYAVSTCATSGIYSPRCLDPSTAATNTCDLGPARASLAGLYALIGVPLFAVTCGQLGFVGISFAVDAVQRNRMLRPVTKAEFDYACRILSPNDELNRSTVNRGEYILLKFMQMGVTYQAQIEAIMSLFVQLDEYEHGVLHYEIIQPYRDSRSNSRADRRTGRIADMDGSVTSSVDGVGTRKVRKKVMRLLKSLRENVLAVAMSILAVFIVVGIVGYKYMHTNWSWAKAYFYLMNACFNIGYGNVIEMDDPGVHVFTVLMIWTANTFVMGSLAFLMSYYLIEDKSFAEVDTPEASSQFDNLWAKVKHYMGWSSNPSLLRIEMLFVTWIAVGTIWGVHFEQWEVVTSIFFAVGTCSTSGIWASPCIDPATYASADCDLGDARSVFDGVFVMIGVPLMGFTMSQFARIGIEQVIEEKNKKWLAKEITKEEFFYCCNILTPTEGIDGITVNRGEYVLMKLMQIGATNRAQIEELSEQFHDIDIEDRGVLSFEEIQSDGRRKHHV